MRLARPLASLFAVVLIGLARGAHGAAGDAIADRVLGQPGFTQNTLPGTPTNASLWGPQGIAIAPDGRLYVADGNNNRVLAWPSAAAFTSGQAADLVIGQPDGTSGLGRQNLSGPVGIAVDGAGNVYVADSGNNRVLEYDAPPTHDALADRVFGQNGDFATGAANKNVRSASSLARPYGVAVDGAGNLYVADRDNGRVLEYDAPLTTDTVADRVFGQTSFTSTSSHPAPGRETLDTPLGVTVDAAGNLFVSDGVANRVLEYDAPLSHDTVADRVLGQVNLTSAASGRGPSNFTQPDGIAVDPAGNVYVADSFNNRILGFVMPFDTDGVADAVFGQPDFEQVDPPAAMSATTLSNPTFLATDAAGTLYASDFVGNRLLAYETPFGNQPPLVTQVSATPNPAGVGQNVTFTIAGGRPAGGAVAVGWDFGDGATGAGAATSHAYAAAGSFTATASLTDGAGTVRAQVVVRIDAPVVGAGLDSDGDGFSDAFELAWGTSPTDAGSAPLASRPTPQALSVASLHIQLDFAHAANDRIVLGGSLSLPKGFNPGGQRVGIDVGGVAHAFTLDTHGKGRDAAGFFTLAGRGRRAKFRMKLASGSFAATLADDGLRRDVKKAHLQVTVSILLDGVVSQKAEPQAFRVKQERIGVSR